MLEKLKYILFGVAMLAAGVSIILVIFYTPYYKLRLFYSGKIISFTVAKKVYHLNRLGGYYMIYSAADNLSVRATIGEEKKIKVGQTISAFYSERVNSGFYTGKETVTLKDVIFYEYESIPFFLVLLALGALTWQIIYSTFKAYKTKYFELHEKYRSEPKYKRVLQYIKSFLPYTIILSTLYVFALIFSKAVLSVETSGFLLTSSVILCGYLSIAFTPLLVLKGRTYFEKAKFFEVFRLIVKIGLASWTFYKSLQFLIETDLTKFGNVSEVLVSLVKFICDF